MRYAALDIGTNTLLMVIAQVDSNGNYEVLEDEHSVARLGEGVDKTGLINPEATARASTILERYKPLCNKHSVDRIKICGTSALRDARNSPEVRDILGKIMGTEIETIHGEVEAGLSFAGTVEDESNSLVIDIGGGSTEFIFGAGDKLFSKQSLQMGAVRITERFIDKLPPTPEEITTATEFIKKEISQIDIPIEEFKLYAVAGTPTTIAQVALKMQDYDFDKIQGYELSANTIKSVLEDFNHMTLKELQTTPGVNPLRADIIGAGTMILLESLRHFESKSCIVSAKGLRYGILKFMIEENLR
jgi:exopolyphosphatase / guanosine-5'-triphosphate,3'-diphosphate pyrophosphatase